MPGINHSIFSNSEIPDYEVELADDFFSSVNQAIESAVVFVLCSTTTLGNWLTIVSMLCLRGKREPMDFYVLSLSIANLINGFGVIPMSLVATAHMLEDPVYNYELCCFSGYLQVSLSAVNLYTFMWMSVDRYIATRKPLRYDAIQTRTRGACWVIFAWIMSLSLCCPPLLGNSEGHFYEESFLCMLDASAMLPYSGTMGALVFLPTVLTVCYTYSHIFSTPPAAAVKDEEENAHSDYMTAFLVTIVFVISWLPWVSFKLIESLISGFSSARNLRFWLLWIGELHGTWTPFILISSSARCQTGAKLLCTSDCSKQNNEDDV